MITKERLEDLIEQGADIWKIEDGKVYPLRKDHYQYWNIKEDRLQWYCKIVPSGYCCISFNHLFETKEDAEEYAEFGNITRTEKLEFPSWEEFRKCDKSVKFYNKQNEYSMYVFVKNRNTNNCRIIIYADDGEQDWFIFQQPLSKENYDEARRLCVKLFKGEKDE